MTSVAWLNWTGIVMSVAMGIIVWKRGERNRLPFESKRFAPVISPFSILGGCIGLFLCSVIFRLIPVTYSIFWTASLLAQAGIYYSFLLFLHPFLRRIVSGTDRAVLWVLPQIRYIFYIVYMKVTPRWIIPVTREWIITILIVWGAGAAMVLLWNITEHIRFRHKILRYAYDAPPEARAILYAEEQKLQPRKEYALCVSPYIRTPLSVGIFERSLRIVLPERMYSDEELKLIFRHELVHIRRQDSATKLFLAVCIAFFWFNPFVWLSRRCACEDFESGCDELVLAGEDDNMRKLYAELILTTADTRGFTTCLSSDAVSVRSRLKDVMDPKQKAAGSLVAALLTLILFITGGMFGVAYDAQSGRFLLFNDMPAEEISYNNVIFMNETGSGEFAKGAHEVLTGYLSDMQLYRLAADSNDISEPALLSFCVMPEGVLSIWLCDRTVTTFNEHTQEWHTYYHSDGVDWESLLSMLKAESS